MDMTHLPAVRPTEGSEDADVDELNKGLGADDDADLEDYDVEELPDGSAVMRLPGKDKKDADDAFEDNLLEHLEHSVVTTIASDLIELITADKTSREERDKQYAEGIKRTGLGKDAPGGADFDGASRAVHPMLAKGSVDFASKAIKELYPATGPCKTQIIGENTEAKVDKAERKRQYMNWQMTTQVPENRAEFERLLSQVPLGGSQYKRWWWDVQLQRPRTETVYVDDVFLPYNQSDFYTSNRVTHRQYIGKQEYEARVASGLYSEDVKITVNSPGMSERSESSKASDKVEGAEEEFVAYNDEGLREMYQVYADLVVEGDKFTKERVAPYIVHMSAVDEKIVGIYRNWDKEDEKFEKKHWMVEYTFIPWRGAYGIGLIHLIGSLAGAATGALRALLDSAHIQNFPGGLKLKGGRTAGQSIQVNATELAEIAAPPGVDDIRKLVMPFPFSGPSQTLFNVLEWLGQQAEATVATANEKIADAGANMPMGTALALIEQGSVNFSAIHARMHTSLKREMQILHRLNKENLSDKEVVEELGELVVSRGDFDGPMDVIPVSDPNIFSETQRYAQLQAVLQLKADPQFAQFFKPDRLLARALKLLQIPGAEDIASLPKDPKRLDPLAENAMVAGEDPSPLKVYPDQDDIGHLQAHLAFMTSPMFGGSQLFGQQTLPPLLAHCKEHMMALYKKHTKAATGLVQMLSKEKGIEMSEDKAAAHGAAFADKILAQTLGPMVMPALQQAQQLAKQFAPPPPVSPDVQAAEQSKQAIAQANNTNAQALKNMDITYQRERDTADRDQNAAAAQMATQMEMLQTNVDKQIAQFTGSLQLMRDSNANDAKFMLVQFQAEQQNLNTVLTNFLTRLETTQAKPTTIVVPESLDLGLQLQPLIENTASGNAQLAQHILELQNTQRDSQQATSQVLAQVVAGMQQLFKITAAPRHAQYVMGPNGRPTGVTSSVQMPQDQQPVSDVQPNPQLQPQPQPGAMPQGPQQ